MFSPSSHDKIVVLYPDIAGRCIMLSFLRTLYALWGWVHLSSLYPGTRCGSRVKCLLNGWISSHLFDSLNHSILCHNTLKKNEALVMFTSFVSRIRPGLCYFINLNVTLYRESINLFSVIENSLPYLRSCKGMNSNEAGECNICSQMLGAQIFIPKAILSIKKYLISFIYEKIVGKENK